MDASALDICPKSVKREVSVISAKVNIQRVNMKNETKIPERTRTVIKTIETLKG